MEKANKIINKSFEGETDDYVLKCSLCDLPFVSLHNKQSHYSGKLHLQTLLQRLNELVTSNQRTEEVSFPLYLSSAASSNPHRDDGDKTTSTAHLYHSTSLKSSMTVVGDEYEGTQ